MNVRDARSARALALSIRKRLDEIARSVSDAPGLVRIATDARGDDVAFWNDGRGMEYNVSAAQRMLYDISRAFPEAVQSRSGQQMSLRIELPISK